MGEHCLVHGDSLTGDGRCVACDASMVYVEVLPREFVEHCTPDCSGGPCVHWMRSGDAAEIQGKPYRVCFPACGWRTAFLSPGDKARAIAEHFGIRLLTYTCEAATLAWDLRVKPFFRGTYGNHCYWDVRDVVRALPSRSRPRCIGCGRRLSLRETVAVRNAECAPFCMADTRSPGLHFRDRCLDSHIDQKEREKRWLKESKQLLSEARGLLRKRPTRRDASRLLKRASRLRQSLPD